MPWIPTLRGLAAAALLLTYHQLALALEPPTREQIERYRRNGTLADRVAAAYRIGNHRVAPHLVRSFGERFGVASAKSEAMPSSLPATGSPNVFALLIEFSDHRLLRSARHPGLDPRLVPNPLYAQRRGADRRRPRGADLRGGLPF